MTCKWLNNWHILNVSFFLQIVQLWGFLEEAEQSQNEKQWEDLLIMSLCNGSNTKQNICNFFVWSCMFYVHLHNFRDVVTFHYLKWE